LNEGRGALKTPHPGATLPKIIILGRVAPPVKNNREKSLAAWPSLKNINVIDSGTSRPSALRLLRSKPYKASKILM